MAIVISAALFGDEYDLVADFGGDFDAWNEQYASLPPPDDAIRLHIPAGHYGDAASSRFGYGNTGAVIRGEGMGVTFVKIVFSGAASFEGDIDGGPMIRLEDVSAGSQTVTLKDPVTYASELIEGRWCCIMGWAMQLGGYPPNNHFFEFHRITDVNAGTGVVTLDEPLSYSYSDLWPTTVEGSFGSADCGGPATLFPLNKTFPVFWPMDPDRQHFDQSLTIKDLTIENGPGESWFGNARSIRWERVQFSGFSGTASGGIDVTYESCLFDGSSIEIDKEVEVIAFRNTDFDGAGVNVQSSSIDLMIYENCNSLSSGGVFAYGKNAEFTNCDLYRWRNGPTSYGAPERCSIIDCNCQEVFTDLFFRHIDLSEFTSIVSGVFTIPTADFINSDILLTITPGTIATLATTQENHLKCFNVISAEVVGLNLVVTTDLPASPPEMALAARWGILGPRDFTVSGCTGTLTPYNGHSNQVAYTHMRQTVDGSGNVQPGSAASDKYNGYEFVCLGTIVSVTIDVVQAYTGVQPTLTICPFSDGGTPLLFAADHTTLVFWNPQVNCKIAGTRIITPGSTTGTQSGDTNITLAAGDNWLPRGGHIAFSADISGESSGVRPIVTITIETDQGV